MKITKIILALSLMVLFFCTVTSPAYARKKEVPPVNAVEFQDVKKIDLVVVLYLTEELRTYSWLSKVLGLNKASNLSVELLGALFAQNSKTLAETIFTNVKVVNDKASLASIEADVIITPEVLSLIRTRPMAPWKDQTTTAVLQWIMTETGENLIWIETVTGNGTAKFGGGGKIYQDRRYKADTSNAF